MPGVYLMPNGKVASVDLGDGRVSLVSRAKFQECCCPPPAPCECPCEIWPPAEWPCEGLLEEYSVNYDSGWITALNPNGTPIGGVDEVRIVFTSTAKFVVNEKCRWTTGQQSFDYSGSKRKFPDGSIQDIGGGFGDRSPFLNIRLSGTAPNCFWGNAGYAQADIGFQLYRIPGGIKDTGLNLAGRYAASPNSMGGSNFPFTIS